MENKKLEKYPKTELFQVIDTIGVPHPFCITHHHLEQAHKMHSMYLNESVIDALEKETGRPSCGVRGCNLKFSEHEQALLVNCKTKDKELTRSYLLSIKELCEADGYAGFTLVDGTGE